MKEIFGGLLVILLLGGTLAELMYLVAKVTADADPIARNFSPDVLISRG